MPELQPLMNDTKWDELRLAMYELAALRPRWRTRDLKSGYICPWDGEWFYHFREGGYAGIEGVELEITSSAQEAAVLGALRQVHVPGHRTEAGFTVYGYAPGDTPLDHL
jgi:hypothetical protein